MAVLRGFDQCRPTSRRLSVHINPTSPQNLDVFQIRIFTSLGQGIVAVRRFGFELLLISATGVDQMI